MAVRNLVQAAVQPCDLAWTVPKLGLDIAAEMRFSSESVASFEIEVKSFGGQRVGGVGFGNKRGGPRVDLLLSSEDPLDAHGIHVRWAFVDATLPPSTRRYALLSCLEARKVAMGAIARGKLNNFSISGLKAYWTV